MGLSTDCVCPKSKLSTSDTSDTKLRFIKRVVTSTDRFECLKYADSAGKYGRHIFHDDVIKWKHFPRYWPFVRGIHRSPVNSPHKGQWRGALMFTLICAWINDWVNNRKAGDLKRRRAHYDVTVMLSDKTGFHGKAAVAHVTGQTPLSRNCYGYNQHRLLMSNPSEYFT